MGIPFVVVIGKKELNMNKFLVKSRISDKKIFLSVEELKDYFSSAKEEYSRSLYDFSLRNLQNSIVEVKTLDEAKSEILNNGKIVLVP